VAALVFLCGCGGGVAIGSGSVQVWPVPASAIVFSDAVPTGYSELYRETEKTIRIDAAINEVASFQLAMAAQGNVPAGVRNIRVTDFRQGAVSVAASHVRLYRELRIPVEDYPAWYLRLTPHLRAKREYPDVLVPLESPKGALPIDLPPGRTEAVWVDVHIPPGTEPGAYSGRIELETGGGATQGLAVLLTVWPFAIPQTRHAPVIAGLDTAGLIRNHVEIDRRPYSPSRLSSEDPFYERAVQVVDQAMRLLHEHRLSPVLWDLRPAQRVVSGGGVELDWSDYDRLVSGIMDGSAFEDRTAAAAWPLPFDERDPSPDLHGGVGSETYERYVADYLSKCVAHFERRGWLDRHFVWVPLSDGTRAERFKAFERIGRLLKRVEPRLRLVCPLSPMSLEPYGYLNDPFVDVSNLVSIWCPPSAEADRTVLARERTVGKQVWLSPGRPPYTGSLSVIASPVDAGSLAWQIYRFGYDGACLSVVNDWGREDAIGPTGSERQLIWSGKPYGLCGPVPSIRLKRLLRGLQDYEYLWLLDRNRRPAIAKLLSTDLFRYGGTECFAEHFLDSRGPGWVTEPAAWSIARGVMARELQVALSEQGDRPQSGQQDDVARFAEEMEWSRLVVAIRRTQVVIEGVKARFEPQDAAGPVHLEATVSFFNATPRPFEGRLLWAGLPQGWTADDDGRPIGPIEPTRGARVVIGAKARVIQPNTDGIVPVQFVLQPSQGEPTVFTGRLCVLVAQRIGKPFVVDGRLDDWPLATNVASDFLLVGAGEVPKTGRASPNRPSQLTTVFACSDDEALYIAFNCAESDLAGRRITRSNYVEYDDLWPVGEDLVEMVLDPSGQAVGPGDLYHVVVKANGAVLAEKGIRCLDRVAPVSSWASGITAAVDDGLRPGCWTVEIRIPLASLGKRGDVIGANFARFDARRGEYSSWTACRSHIYSPITLGNMQLGR